MRYSTNSYWFELNLDIEEINISKQREAEIQNIHEKVYIAKRLLAETEKTRLKKENEIIEVYEKEYVNWFINFLSVWIIWLSIE